MDRMRSRKPTFKGQPSLVSRETHEDFKPAIEWIDDQSRRILLVQLPGFKREEIRVQLDKAGKLLIKGSKQVSENKYLDVDQTFDVPEDTIADEIRGRFEDGRLRLVMPKREVREFVGEKKEEPSHEEKKDEHTEEERPKDTGEKQNELAREEKAKSIEEEKKEAAAKYEHPEDKATSREEKEEDTGEKQSELTREEKAKSIEEEKKEAAAKYEHPEEKTTSKESAAKHEHPEEKTTSREEKEEDRKEDKPNDTEEKQNELTRNETQKSKDEPLKDEESKDIEEKTTKMKKKSRGMRERIPSWLDSGTLGELNRNKKVIAVAVVSFSAGVYACHKLSTWGMS